MINFAVITVATGSVARHGWCQPDQLSIQAQTGEIAIDLASESAWTGDDAGVVWNGAVLVTKTLDAGAQLAAAKAGKIAALNAAYAQSQLAPVSYTTKAGATAQFNQAPSDIDNLQKAILGSQASGTWPLNLWQDATGAVITPFTFADLQGLAAAMEAQDTPDYTHLLALLAAVTAATTLEAVAAITW